MHKQPLLPIFVLLVALAFPAGSNAGQISEGSATIRLEVNLSDLEQPRGFWRQTLSYLGMRKLTTPPPAPGTGMVVHSSAYAPSPYQTDSTPCITAAGTRVRPGVVAANFLPFGTLIEINNQVYIVEDRMNPRYPNSIDIFFPSTSQALAFGRQELNIVIIGYGKPGQPLPREVSAAAAQTDEATQAGSQEIAEADSEPPDFTDRIIGRIAFWQQVAGDIIGIKSYDVNRYDVDCFS